MIETIKIYYDLTADNVPEQVAYLTDAAIADATAELIALREEVGKIAPQLQADGDEVRAAKVLKPKLRKALDLVHLLQKLGVENFDTDPSGLVHAIELVNQIIWDDQTRKRTEAEQRMYELAQRRAEIEREKAAKLAPTDVIRWGPPDAGGWKANQIRQHEKKTRLKK